MTQKRTPWMMKISCCLTRQRFARWQSPNYVLSVVLPHNSRIVNSDHIFFCTVRNLVNPKHTFRTNRSIVHLAISAQFFSLFRGKSVFIIFRFLCFRQSPEQRRIIAVTGRLIRDTYHRYSKPNIHCLVALWNEIQVVLSYTVCISYNSDYQFYFYHFFTSCIHLLNEFYSKPCRS